MLCLHGHCILALRAHSCADFLSKVVFSLYLVQRVFYLFLRPEASTVVKYDNVFKLTITWRYFFLDKFLCHDFPFLCTEKRQQYDSYLLSVLFNSVLWKPFFKDHSHAFELGHLILASLEGQHKNDRSKTKCSVNKLQQLSFEKLCSRYHINMTEDSFMV